MTFLMRQTRNIFCILVALLSFSRAATAGEVPARIEGKIVFVKATVNGEGPFTFVVDTGATVSVLTPSAAKKAGLKEKPGSPLNPVAGSVRTIAVGDAELRNLPVQIFDPPQAVSLRLDKGVDYSGILGFTFLNNFITTIDYAKKTVRFEAPDAKRTTPADATRIPLRRDGDLLFASAYVNGKGPFVFLVDTGSAEIVLQAGMPAKVNMSTETDPKWPGVQFGIADTVSLGKTAVTNVPVVVKNLPANGYPHDGIVGYPFLSRFAVTISYRDKSLTLAPVEARDEKK